MLSARISSYGWSREVWEREKNVRVAQGAAGREQLYWSFLIELQTSQVHPELNILTAKSMK